MQLVEVVQNSLRDVADVIKDTHIDWGTGAGQVSADDIPDGTTNAIVTLAQESSWDSHLSASQAHSDYLLNNAADTGVALTLADATSVPLTLNNQTGTQSILDVQDNGITVVEIIDGGYAGFGGLAASSASSLRTQATGSATFGLEVMIPGTGTEQGFSTNPTSDDYKTHFNMLASNGAGRLGFATGFGNNGYFATTQTRTILTHNHSSDPPLRVNQQGTGDIADFQDSGTKVVGIPDGGGIQIKEISAAGADTAGYGQLWCKDNAGTTELWFTTDTGTDIKIV